MSGEYEQSVFINCPFDNDYAPFFDAILFTIFKCKFVPRCALEHDDASQTRIDKINDIILDCKYGIHDISRTELDAESDLPRFNMPLELGLFLGCKRFSSGRQKEKICIIFDSERYRYQKFISDVSGQDIKSHDHDPKTLITKLRNVFNTNLEDRRLLGATAIQADYEAYLGSKSKILELLELSEEDELTYADHVEIIQRWIAFHE